MFTIEVCSCLM